MECEKYKEFLWDYLEGKEIPYEVLKHIENCNFCLKEMEKIKKTLEILNNLKENLIEPYDIREDVFEEIEKYERLRKNVKNFSLITSPVFFIFLLFIMFNFYKNKKAIEIIYPEEAQVLIPEEVYFTFKIPKNKNFVVQIDTNDITENIEFFGEVCFFDASDFEMDPGYHIFKISVFDEKGKIIKKVEKTFYLTNYKSGEYAYSP
jgi:hypothetical protein